MSPSELKQILLALISETRISYDKMVARSSKLKEMLTLMTSRVQFDENIYLKERDIDRMNGNFIGLMDTLEGTAQMELQFNEKIRENAKVKVENGVTRKRNEFLEKLTERLQLEARENKAQLKQFKEDFIAMTKQKVQNSNQIQVLLNRLDTLEKGMEVANQEGQPSQIGEHQLKRTLNFMVRESQEQKKEIAFLKTTLATKDKEVERVKAKLLKLQETNNDLTGEVAKKGEQVYFSRKSTILSSKYAQMYQDQDEQLPTINFVRNQGNSLDFRQKAMSFNSLETLKDLIESGSSFFVEYLFQKETKENIMEKFQTVSDGFINDHKFLTQVNKVCGQLVCLSDMTNLTDLVSSSQKSIEALVDGWSRCSLWVHDKVNQELWTEHGARHISVSSSLDLIGESMSQKHAIYTTSAATHYAFDQDYDEQFPEDRERDVVLVIPVLGLEPGKVAVGVIEICMSRPLKPEEVYAIDLFANMLASVLSKLVQTKQSQRDQHVITELTNYGFGLFNTCQTSEKIEKMENLAHKIFFNCKTQFNTFSNNKLIKSAVDEDGQNKDQMISSGLAFTTAATRVPAIYSFTQDHPLFNGTVDIASQLPVLFMPITDRKNKDSNQVLGVLQIVQGQLKLKKGDKKSVEDIDPWFNKVARLISDFYSASLLK